ncbi:MAG TPA: RNA polymerase sigma factor [Kofleriaceae bacterium]|jgi:RNA polymerase sigma-70 factor (ECF subfamily)|nr:RNA polymerase sigma factor [Kofleriaceae bacterium]
MEDGPARFRRLIEPVHDKALAFARCLSRSRSDGDDLFQEALVRALVKVDALREDGAFRPWLYRIVINVHRNRCRRAFWSRFLPLGSDAEPEDHRANISGSDYRTSDWSPDAAEATQRARTALAGLPTVQREAIVLFEIEGWQVDEIAEIQAVSASAVKSRLARGRARLREYYEKQMAGEGLPTVVTSGDTP